MEDFTTVRDAIRLFNWMSKDRFRRCGKQPATLRADGPTEPFTLDGDPRDPYSRIAVKTLCDLGFLTEELKPTDKAERLVEENEKADKAERYLYWTVVAHCGLFVDICATPPNLNALLMGEEWNPDDRIVITCHDPKYLLVSHLPRLLASEADS
jgi:hypothetical protein